jgi:predicted transcriptional regulator
MFFTYKGGMKIMITLKLDPKMKKGIEKLAEEQLVNMSTVIRQAVDKHLKEHDIDWRKEDTEK